MAISHAEADERSVELKVKGTDPLTLHAKLPAMKDIVGEKLRGVCEREPHLCCSGMPATG